MRRLLERLRGSPKAPMTEAVRWLLVQEDRPLREDERRAFHSWLAAARENRTAFRDAQRAWSAAGRLRVHIGSPAAEASSRAPHRLWRHVFPIHVTTMLVVAVSVGLMWWVLPAVGAKTYRTGVGEFARVVLADGSAVNLNTSTALQVHLRAHRRELNLLQGEASFNVAHDASRPFEVEANGMLIRALGTIFNVKVAGKRSVEVTVEQGRVLVSSAPEGGSNASGASQGSTIEAGQVAIARPTGISVKRPSGADISRRLAWLEGEVVLQGEPLVEAIEEFNRYSPRLRLRVGDPSIADLRVGGRFRAGEMDSFVAALESSFGIRSEREGDVIVLMEGRTGGEPTRGDAQ